MALSGNDRTVCRRTEFWGGVAAADGSVLAFGAESRRRGGPVVWRLSPDGSASRPERLPDLLDYDSVIAGDGERGIVVVPSSGGRRARDILIRVPGGVWTTVVLPRSSEAPESPLAAAVTRSGFVVVGADCESLIAWRSADGTSWGDPLHIADSFDEGFPHICARPTLVRRESRARRHVMLHTIR